MSNSAGRDVYVVECVRTPIAKGKSNGALNSKHPVHLLSHTLNQLMVKSGVDKKYVEDVICGVVTPVQQQGANIPRLALLHAGFPVTVPGVQLNRMCGSGQQAVHFASQAISSGDLQCAVACGVEMMSVVPMGSDAAPEVFSGQPNEFTDSFPYKLIHQGMSAELVAEKYGVSRQECDDLALQSHKKMSDAINNGYFKNQIINVEVENIVESQNEKGETVEKKVKSIVTQDEGLRWPLDIKNLNKLKSVFKEGGVVTAGNASQISDGASAVLLCSGDFIRQHKLVPRARIIARSVVASDPTVMLDAVIPATQKVLAQAGLKMSDIDLFEVNEAFASVVLAWAKSLKADMNKVNVNGGAIAHGHPLGASGCVLMTKLVNELERRQVRYGLQTMCIGHGQATATIVERLTSEQQKQIMNQLPSKL